MPFTPKYSYEEKLNACNLYVVEFGSSIKVSKATGIPATTIRSWSQTDWWADMVSMVRARHQDKLDGKMTGMITMIMDKQLERINKGDAVVLKNGELAFKPVSLRDLTDAMDKVIRNRALSRGEPSSIKKTISIDKKLEELQDKLSDIGKKRTEQIDEVVKH